MGRVDDEEGEILFSHVEVKEERVNSEAEEEKEASDAEDLAGDSRKKYKCTHPGCKYRFQRPSRLTWHLRKHNDDRPFKCDQEGCSRAYTNASHLKRHLNTSHKSVSKNVEMRRVDDEEGDSVLSDVEIKEEIVSSEAEDDKYKDMDTSEAEEDEKDMEKEASDAEDSEGDTRKKYKCTQPGCKLRFLRPSRLTWHLRKHNDERPYKCDQEGCTRAYTNSSHLKRHLNTYHKPVSKIYECKECGMELSSLHSLKRHNKKIHDPTRLTCAECGAKFRKKHCYNEHLSMHAGVAMYKCDICDQDFTTLRNYKKHHRIHEGPKTYTCTSAGCTETFDKWSKLSKHLEVEHEFDHKCEKCNKKFKHKRQLAVHSAVHVRKGVVLTCPYENCPRFYTYSRNLEEHIQTAHMGRKFICDMCDKPFNFKSTVARHIQVVHEGKVAPPPKKKRSRRRKDAGVPRKSMAAKLVGLELPKELEKRILLRKPQIILERIDEKSSDKSKSENRTAPPLTLNNANWQNETTTKNHEEKSFEPPEKKNEHASPSSLTSEKEIANNEGETAMIVDDHFTEVANMCDKNDGKLVISAINALQGKTTMLSGNIEEKSSNTSNTAEKKNEVVDPSLEKKNNVIPFSLTSEKEIANNEGETAMIVDDHSTELANMCDKNDGKLVISAINALQGKTPMLLGNIEEKSSNTANTAEKKDEVVDPSLEKKNDVISSALTSDKEIANHTNGTAMILDDHVQEFAQGCVEELSRRIRG